MVKFLILNKWETDLQKSMDFLLNPFCIPNDLHETLLYYMYTWCYTKKEYKFKLTWYEIRNKDQCTIHMYKRMIVLPIAPDERFNILSYVDLARS